MKIFARSYFLLLVILTATNVYAQADATRLENIKRALPVIDNLYKEFAENNHVPGLVYGLVVDGKLVHTAKVGFINAGKQIPTSSQADFHIASMTKSFTAMAILKLRDEGKLQLDDPVYRYIPEMKGQKYPTTDAAEITVRHLLTHAAGFPEDNPWGDRQLAATNEEMIAMIKKGLSFSTVPGSAYEYSNLGFAMLGYIIQKVSGLSYDRYITNIILVPLGMTHTYWDYKNVPAVQLAQGYRWLNGKWVEQPMLSNGAYGAMGGMITSMEDFSKYVSLHLSAWPARSDAETGPVKRSSIREMQQAWNISALVSVYKYPGGRSCPIVTAYGYGLRHVHDCDNRIMVGHSGGLPGFGSDWKILPAYGIGIICFSNLTYTSGGNVNVQALDTLVALAKLTARPLPVSSILEQRKNELITFLPDWNNAAASGLFADNFFLDYFTDSLKREATNLFNKAGKIIRINEFVPLNNLRGSFVMEGEFTKIEVSFTLTPENPPLIQEYHIREIKK